MLKKIIGANNILSFRVKFYLVKVLFSKVKSWVKSRLYFKRFYAGPKFSSQAVSNG